MSENKRYDYYLEKTLDKIFDVNSTANPKTSIISERFHARLNNFFDGYKLVQNDLKMYNYRDYKGRLLSDDWFDRGYEFKMVMQSLENIWKIVIPLKKTLLIEMVI